MTKLGRILLITFSVLALAAGVAYADATIYAGPPSSFYGGDVSIAQGEKITFTNLDTIAHDVTASAKSGDGKPLFASAQVSTGGSAPVSGVEALPAGSYPYICSLHPFMTGTITVTGAGAPAPGGGSGGGNGGSPPPPASDSTADTVAPSFTLGVLDTKRSAVAKRKALKVALKTNEEATFAITAKAGRTTLATGTSKLAAGSRTLSLRLTKAGLKAAKGRKALKLAVRAKATDAAGNKSTATAAGRLR